MESINNFYKRDVDNELLIGTYMFPYILFDGFQYDNLYSATEIIAEIIVEDEKILITRNGGLFIKPHEGFIDILRTQEFLVDDIKEKIQFEDKFVKYSNRVVCEFCFAGTISEPVTQVHVSRAGLIGNHALITSGGGGREAYYYRTMYPSSQLRDGSWLSNRIVSIEELSQVIRLGYTSQLLKISNKANPNPFL